MEEKKPPFEMFEIERFEDEDDFEIQTIRITIKKPNCFGDYLLCFTIFSAILVVIQFLFF